MAAAPLAPEGWVQAAPGSRHSAAGHISPSVLPRTRQQGRRQAQASTARPCAGVPTARRAVATLAQAGDRAELRALSFPPATLPPGTCGDAAAEPERDSSGRSAARVPTRGGASAFLREAGSPDAFCKRRSKGTDATGGEGPLPLRGWFGGMNWRSSGSGKGCGGRCGLVGAWHRALELGWAGSRTVSGGRSHLGNDDLSPVCTDLGLM